MRKFILTGLMALALVGVQPAEARADFDSSMTALCVGVGGDCSEIMFELRVYGANYIGPVFLESLIPGTWQFSTGTSFSGDVGNVAWSTSLPYSFSVTMASYGSYGELVSGNAMRYQGDANTVSGTGAGSGSFEGTVTPEPVTSVLLATGLVGIGFLAHRRKKLDLESDEA
jgi:hypothetical protein